MSQQYLESDGSVPARKPNKSSRTFVNASKGLASETSGSPLQVYSADSYDQHTTDEDHMDVDEQNYIEDDLDSDEYSTSDQPFTRMFANVSGANAQTLSFMDLMLRLGQTHATSTRYHQTPSGEFHAVLENLNQRDDPYLVLESVKDLSERLLMMDGLTAERAIPVNKLTKSLVNVLIDPLLAEDLELHLVTCRCLFNLVELNQDYIIDAITNGAIEALIPKLIDIVYIDLTEQCLQLLEILSQDKLSHNRFLKNDGFKACLKNLDFLTVHSQRKCLKIVSNLSSSICETHCHFIEDEFVTLLNVLLFQDDAALLESAKLSIFRIIECLKNDAEKLELLFSQEALILQLVKIAFDSFEEENSTKSLTLFSSVILNSLISLAKSSPSVRQTLLQRDLGLKIQAAVLNEVPRSFEKTHKYGHVGVSFNDPKQTLALLLLVTCFIPDPKVSEDNAFLLGDLKEAVNSFDSFELDKIVRLSTYVNQIYPVLISLYHDSSDSKVRLQVLRELYKILSFSDILKDHLHIETKNSIGILADTLFESRDLLLTRTCDKLSSVEVAHILASCLIIQVVLNINDPVLIRYMQREGVLADLKAINDYLEDQMLKENPSNGLACNNLKLIKKRNVSHYIEQIELAISKLDNTSHKSYLTLEHLLTRILNEFGSINYQTCKSIWSSLANVLSSDDPPTSHEFLTLQILDRIHLLLCDKGQFETPATEAFVEVFFSNNQFLRHLVAILHSIVNRTHMDSHARGVKELFPVRRPLNNRRVLLKLIPDVSDESTAPLEGKDFMLLAPGVISFATIEHFVILRLNSDFKPESDLNHLGTNSVFINTLTHSVLFFYRQAPILKTTSLFGMLVASNSFSDATSIYSKVHEIPFKVIPVIKSTSIFYGKQLKPITNLALGVLNRISAINETLFSTGSYVPSTSFENRSLSLKMEMPLNGSSVISGNQIPEWCFQVMLSAPLVLPMDLKMHFFNSVSFGMARKLEMLNGRQSRINTSDGRSIGLSQLLSEPEGYSTKTKLQINRKALFASALKVLQDYNALTSILEIQFYEEVGSGLGPTLEFYTLVAKGFSEQKNMWRNALTETQVPESGLFPSPIVEISSRTNQKSVRLFKALGQFVARAIVDARNLDFYFSPIFLRALQDWPEYTRMVKNLSDVAQLLNLLRQVDRVLANSLWQLLPMALQNQTCVEEPGCFEPGESNVTDLFLTFVLPGYPELELVENGKEVVVSEENLVEYVKLVAGTILEHGISNQVLAFHEGLSSLLPRCFLHLFSVTELNDLMGNNTEDWTIATLEKSIIADHGYSMDSNAIKNFLSIISEFQKSERREFLQFLTGSPRLPIGGFSQLKPQLTIVKKHVEAGSRNDDHLPSVMTCANYLKLPDYSLRAIMRAKFVQAMKEGSNAFLLS